MTLTRCRLCLIPDTRPDTYFADGVCSACVTHAKRPSVDWQARHNDLCELLERHRNPTGFDCIVASSGGKDSHWQALRLIDLGARPLIVTATTCHLTDIGRANIDNLARYATTIEVTPNRSVRAALNRTGLRLVGDISWPEHVSIFTTPFRVACALGIPLVFYGENPQAQYGGPPGADEARRMTRRWVSEFGGFLGLRPADMVGQDGLCAHDLHEYLPPEDGDLERVGVEAHFLGQYLEWDSHRNAQAAIAAGMRAVLPSAAAWWQAENQDNAQTGLHDFFCWLKYGYGRGCAQVSVDIRNGLIDRAAALEWVEAHDGLLPYPYMGVTLDAVLDRIGMARPELDAIMERFTNRSIFPEAVACSQPA